MFYAPFGCTWRKTNTWMFNTDGALASITKHNRLSGYTTLKINQTKFMTATNKFILKDGYQADDKKECGL